jgi:hypothetical protein
MKVVTIAVPSRAGESKVSNKAPSPAARIATVFPSSTWTGKRAPGAAAWNEGGIATGAIILRGWSGFVKNNIHNE